MNSFPPRPLGSRIPDRLHAVSCSLPTMRDVIGYEEKDASTIQHMSSGYPRFVIHPMLVTIERGLERREVERENRKLRFLVNKRVRPPKEDESGIAAARRDWERGYISDLLRQTRGNVTKAAELARISRPNLHKKIRALGIDPALGQRRHGGFGMGREGHAAQRREDRVSRLRSVGVQER